MILEITALSDIVCICFQVIDGKRDLLDQFCGILKEENIPFKVSDRMIRCPPAIRLPKS